MQSKTVLAAVGLTSIMLSQLTSAGCQDDYWPVHVGGSNGDEDVRCFDFDPVNEQIIVGGVTNSDDFGPTEDDHGYLYALDLDGNWKWGQFFYNVSNPISSIDGCSMSATGQSLAVQGQANNVPVLMNINTADGSLEQFIHTENTSSETASYETHGAVFLDDRDWANYFYTSFTIDPFNNGQPEVVLQRVKSSDFGVAVIWSKTFPVGQQEETKWLNQPNVVAEDPKLRDQIWWVGQYEGKGSVAKFDKLNGGTLFRITLKDSTTLTALTQLNGDQEYSLYDNYVCGHNETSDGGSTAIIAQIDSEGHSVPWIKTASGKNRWATDIAYDEAPQDRCLGISIENWDSKSLAVVIQSKASQYQAWSSGPSYDTILVRLSHEGWEKDISVITQDNGIDMFSSKNGILWRDGDVYFAGYSSGFNTHYQEMSSDWTDSYVYKYRFGTDSECLRVTRPELDRTIDVFQRYYAEDTYAHREIIGEYAAIKPHDFDDNADEWSAQASIYSQGFDTFSSIKSPRACAWKWRTRDSYSSKEPIVYYSGQESTYYDQWCNRYQTCYRDSEITLSDGTSADGLIEYSWEIIHIQIEDPTILGDQSATIRQCDAEGHLHEYGFDFEVLENTPPYFEKEVKTSHSVQAGKRSTYYLPWITDDEGHKFKGSIEPTPGKEDRYAEFVSYGIPRQLSFEAEEGKHDGIYYFTVVIRDSYADSVRTTVDCTVEVNSSYSLNLLQETQSSNSSSYATGFGAGAAAILVAAVAYKLSPCSTTKRQAALTEPLI